MNTSAANIKNKYFITNRMQEPWMLKKPVSDICNNIARIIIDDNNNFTDHDIIVVLDYIANIYTWLYVNNNFRSYIECEKKLDEITKYMNKNHAEIWQKTNYN